MVLNTLHGTTATLQKASEGEQPDAPSPCMANSREPCPFLLLPLELRRLIYSYLLSTKYTRENKIERLPASKKSCRFQSDTNTMTQVSDGKYKGYHYQPTYTYRFQPAILRCNRQINEEATAVFHNTNLFISISHNYSHISPENPGRMCSLLEHYCEQEGLPILASIQSARLFKYFAMEIYFGKTLNRRLSKTVVE